MDDLYSVLGVSRSASADEIKRAYREAAFKYHPDRNPGNSAAEEQFKKINAAYAVLGDEKKRAEYDRGGYSDPFAEQNTTGGYERYNPYGTDQDPFEAWFGSAGGQYSRHQYTYRYGANGWQRTSAEYDENRDYYAPQYTKRDAAALLLRSILLFFLGTFLFRMFWFIIPFGPLLSIGIIINGAVGALKAIQVFFKIKPKQ